MSKNQSNRIPIHIKGLGIFIIILMIPVIITSILSSDREMEAELTYSSGVKIKVYLGGISKFIDLEEYIIGVTSSQISAEAPIEAIKAQAVVARTYTMQQVGKSKELDSSKIGQVYLSTVEMKQKWGEQNYYKNYAKIKQAVASTEGVIMIHNNKAIDAVYHGVSSGRTRNAKSMWNKEVPYLVEVDSSEDKTASEYIHKVVISKGEFIEKIKNYNKKLKVTEDKLIENIKIKETDTSDYVIKLEVDNISMSGEELRKVLDLASASFNIEEKGKDLVITTKGVGHGVGLSQYGAIIKAENGNNFEVILKYYYQGTSLKNTLVEVDDTSKQ